MTNVNRTNKRKKYGQDGGALTVGAIGAAAAAAATGVYVGRKIAAASPPPLGGHDFNRTGCSGSETFQCNYYTNNYISPNSWKPINLTVNCTLECEGCFDWYIDDDVWGVINARNGFTLDQKKTRSGGDIVYELTVRFNPLYNSSVRKFLTSSGQADSGDKLILGWKGHQVASFVNFLNFFKGTDPAKLKGWYEEASDGVDLLMKDQEAVVTASAEPHAIGEQGHIRIVREAKAAPECGDLGNVKDAIARGREAMEAETTAGESVATTQGGGKRRKTKKRKTKKRKTKKR